MEKLVTSFGLDFVKPVEHYLSPVAMAEKIVAAAERTSACLAFCEYAHGRQGYAVLDAAFSRCMLDNNVPFATTTVWKGVHLLSTPNGRGEALHADVF